MKAWKDDIIRALHPRLCDDCAKAMAKHWAPCDVFMHGVTQLGHCAFCEEERLVKLLQYEDFLNSFAKLSRERGDWLPKTN